MIDYWHYTDDSTYNSVAAEGLVWQDGPGFNSPFMPLNWTASMGNDDQGLWACHHAGRRAQLSEPAEGPLELD